MDDTPLTQLTEEQKTAHVRNGGANCPYCQSGELDGDSFDSTGHEVSQVVRCLSCDGEWTDVYVLTRIEETS